MNASADHAAGLAAQAAPAIPGHAANASNAEDGERSRSGRPLKTWFGSLTGPGAAIRSRFKKWWQARLPRTDTLALTQRNIYILPTKAGLMFALTLLLLLIASINYQLNLGYALTFLLAGSGLVSMQLTHNTLRGLTLSLRTPPPVFAGEAAVLEAVLASPAPAKRRFGWRTADRYGIGLRFEDAHGATPAWTDVMAGGRASAQLSFVPARRGLHELPALAIETRFPLGLFRAWSVWRPASQILAYPAPERPLAPLPAAQPIDDGMLRSLTSTGIDFEGIRAYRRGDPMKLVVWKKAAALMARGSGELVSRDSAGSAQVELWLDWQQCGSLPPEERLSRLTAWVMAADQAGARYGIRLPGRSLAPSDGDAHRRLCLEALALWA
ncbi:MAG: hypothetical protein JWP52_1117 [Rhizobacter sp.]|nr:hypothetical protein [Rhizobacter sp.]